MLRLLLSLPSCPAGATPCFPSPPSPPHLLPRAVLPGHWQVMEPSAAQLSAAVLALINTLIARQGHARGLVKLAQAFSFARWGLEGYVISESNKLTGGWNHKRDKKCTGEESRPALTLTLP